MKESARNLTGIQWLSGLCRKRKLRNTKTGRNAGGKEAMLTLKRAKELNQTMVTEPHLIMHALSVSAAMGAMAEHFGADKEHWQAIGYLHDYDYEKFPEEHLAHTREPLLQAGVDEDEVRAILAHGYGICSDVKPETDLEKSLYTVDELTGIIGACARMRPG